ncbi:MAG TPA: hypothetical protein VE783_04490 [Candidatus Limnocylindrales bacterium]|jgi:hypothetical protein|nr:hypothetical protein [Candidatus Limnocylindrales bacterium]
MDKLILFYYAVIWGGSRVRGSVRRWKQPLVRGQEWFFNVRVLPGFYEGGGKNLLNRYRLQMLATAAIEIPVAVALILTGHIPYLGWLILVMAAGVHVNHLFNVEASERKARAFAVPGENQPVSAMLVPLQTRRLRDYNNPTIERLIFFGSFGAIAWLVRFYLRSSGTHSFGLVFGMAIFLLYYQLGFVLMKIAVVQWSAPVPKIQAEEHLKAREQRRKFYLHVADASRIMVTVGLVLWPFVVGAPAAQRELFVRVHFIVLMAIAVMFGIRHEMGRNSVLRAAVRANPVRMPDLLNAQPAGWPVCYQPSTPTLLVRAARGYSLNLANRFTLLGAGYLAGFFALIVILRMTQ